MLDDLVVDARRCGPQGSPLPEIGVAPWRLRTRVLQSRLWGPVLGEAHDGPAPDQGRARPQQLTPSLKVTWPRHEARGEGPVAPTGTMGCAALGPRLPGRTAVRTPASACRRASGPTLSYSCKPMTSRNC